MVWGRAIQQRAQTKCLRGHSFEGKNLYITKDGKRQCIECKRIRARITGKKPLRRDLLKAVEFARTFMINNLLITQLDWIDEILRGKRK